MASLGAEPRNVIAAIGPAIPPERYQVGDDVAAAVHQSLGQSAEKVIRPDGTGRWLFDTWTSNQLILREAGLPDGSIHLAPVPTGAEPGLFFSDRQIRPCGRFAAIARLTTERRDNS
jgi:polyphenol oxidase